ncbi:hypothetical protein N7495_007157 [Penicillium taxi]|uniref:uncharacterized protein n=1 Tax=Penicillium taxi TaxID=168475 RepID=UPI0025457114|nr:uncharacterized protein N7495_007157 [Penicillium taxi]KAJ5895466.1 hypothetical protein N7495_007157 [Penicillium taxi]
MHLLFLLGAISLIIASVIADPISSEILYWPVGAPQPSVLAHVTYDPASLKSNLVSYHPPTDTHQDDLIRVGLYTVTPTNPKQWSGSLTSLSSLIDDKNQLTFRLHLGPASEAYHVSLALSINTTSDPRVEAVYSMPGTQPHLNRPVVLSPDGQAPEEPLEKTMLQKYWWVLLIIVFLTVSGGGDEK